MTIKKIAVFGTQGVLSAKIAVSKILSEPQIKARTISENEQTKEVCKHQWHFFREQRIKQCHICGHMECY